MLFSSLSNTCSKTYSSNHRSQNRNLLSRSDSVSVTNNIRIINNGVRCFSEDQVKKPLDLDSSKERRIPRRGGFVQSYSDLDKSKDEKYSEYHTEKIGTSSCTNQSYQKNNNIIQKTHELLLNKLENNRYGSMSSSDSEPKAIKEQYIIDGKTRKALTVRFMKEKMSSDCSVLLPYKSGKYDWVPGHLVLAEGYLSFSPKPRYEERVESRNILKLMKIHGFTTASNINHSDASNYAKKVLRPKTDHGIEIRHISNIKVGFFIKFDSSTLVQQWLLCLRRTINFVAHCEKPTDSDLPNLASYTRSVRSYGPTQRSVSTYSPNIGLTNITNIDFALDNSYPLYTNAYSRYPNTDLNSNICTYKEEYNPYTYTKRQYSTSNISTRPIPCKIYSRPVSIIQKTNSRQKVEKSSISWIPVIRDRLHIVNHNKSDRCQSTRSKSFGETDIVIKNYITKENKKTNYKQEITETKERLNQEKRRRREAERSLSILQMNLNNTHADLVRRAEALQAKRLEVSLKEKESAANTVVHRVRRRRVTYHSKYTGNINKQADFFNSVDLSDNFSRSDDESTGVVYQKRLNESYIDESEPVRMKGELVKYELKMIRKAAKTLF